MAELVRWGKSFPLASKVGQLPLWRFGKLAKSGKGTSDMDAYAVMYDLLESCFTPEGWAAFESAPEANTADEDELLEVLAEAMRQIQERPTGRPSDSSGGSRTTSENSPGASSSPVIDQLVADGRLSVAWLVQERQKSTARSVAST